MNTLEQQTFVDQLNNAEAALSELVGYAENLAGRLVGYADEGEPGYPDHLPSAGYLPGVGDTAERMSRKIETVRRQINRIAQALPIEQTPVKANPLGSAGQIKGYRE